MCMSVILYLAACFSQGLGEISSHFMYLPGRRTCPHVVGRTALGGVLVQG